MEEKRNIFEENIVKKYSYNLIGDMVGIENTTKKQISSFVK
jgi:hypothetical protein